MNANAFLKHFFENFLRIYVAATWSDHFLFSFLSRQEIEEEKQVLCRIFILKIKTRPYQGSLWSECINGPSHISSELFLGILSHKYEPRYCVWVEIFYGLRFGLNLVGNETSVRRMEERKP